MTPTRRSRLVAVVTLVRKAVAQHLSSPCDSGQAMIFSTLKRRRRAVAIPRPPRSPARRSLVRAEGLEQRVMLSAEFRTIGSVSGFGAANPASQVVARHVFYNRSSFDGGDAAATAADDAAIAPDKNALLASQDRLPGFDNVTSYDKGINGVIIDLKDLPVIDALLDVNDFEFSPAGHDPIAVDVRFGAGEGGSERITLIWRDYNPLDASPLPQAVANDWLTVTVKANYHTGLSQPDVFSFGNLIGETGDAPTPMRVSAADLAAVKRVLNATAGIDSRQDVNRNGKVNALDLGIVKSNLNQALPLFAASGALPPSTQALPASPPALFSDAAPGPARRPADDLLA